MRKFHVFSMMSFAFIALLFLSIVAPPVFARAEESSTPLNPATDLLQDGKDSDVDNLSSNPVVGNVQILRIEEIPSNQDEKTRDLFRNLSEKKIGNTTVKILDPVEGQKEINAKAFMTSISGSSNPADKELVARIAGINADGYELTGLSEHLYEYEIVPYTPADTSSFQRASRNDEPSSDRPTITIRTFVKSYIFTNPGNGTNRTLMVAQPLDESGAPLVGEEIFVSDDAAEPVVKGNTREQIPASAMNENSHPIREQSGKTQKKTGSRVSTVYYGNYILGAFQNDYDPLTEIFKFLFKKLQCRYGYGHGCLSQKPNPTANPIQGSFKKPVSQKDIISLREQLLAKISPDKMVVWGDPIGDSHAIAQDPIVCYGIKIDKNGKISQFIGRAASEKDVAPITALLNAWNTDTATFEGKLDTLYPYEETYAQVHHHAVHAIKPDVDKSIVVWETTIVSSAQPAGLVAGHYILKKIMKGSEWTLYALETEVMPVPGAQAFGSGSITQKATVQHRWNGEFVKYDNIYAVPLESNTGAKTRFGSLSLMEDLDYHYKYSQSQAQLTYQYGFLPGVPEHPDKERLRNTVSWMLTYAPEDPAKVRGDFNPISVVAAKEPGAGATGPLRLMSVHTDATFMVGGVSDRKIPRDTLDVVIGRGSQK